MRKRPRQPTIGDRYAPASAPNRLPAGRRAVVRPATQPRLEAGKLLHQWDVGGDQAGIAETDEETEDRDEDPAADPSARLWGERHGAGGKRNIERGGHEDGAPSDTVAHPPLRRRHRARRRGPKTPAPSPIGRRSGSTVQR